MLELSRAGRYKKYVTVNFIYFAVTVLTFVGINTPFTYQFNITGGNTVFAVGIHCKTHQPAA